MLRRSAQGHHPLALATSSPRGRCREQRCHREQVASQLQRNIRVTTATQQGRAAVRAVVIVLGPGCWATMLDDEDVQAASLLGYTGIVSCKSINIGGPHQQPSSFDKMNPHASISNKWHAPSQQMACYIYIYICLLLHICVHIFSSLSSPLAHRDVIIYMHGPHGIQKQ